MSKAFACPCEDVTVRDCEHAVAAGYACFEDLKRFLGVATGPCQGKVCVPVVARILHERAGIPWAQMDWPTFRPPTQPVPLASLAARAENEAPLPAMGAERDTVQPAALGMNEDHERPGRGGRGHP